jgi:mannose-6-phosphate isomerase-like protein (cupin superfamily)
MTAWVKEIREEELGKVTTVPQGKWKRYVSVEADGRGMIFVLGKLEPGEEISHQHVEEELFYVLKGEGEASWVENGTTHHAVLKPGVAFYKTSHIPHTMRNTGNEPLVGLAVKV